MENHTFNNTKHNIPQRSMKISRHQKHHYSLPLDATLDTKENHKLGFHKDGHTESQRCRLDPLVSAISSCHVSHQQVEITINVQGVLTHPCNHKLLPYNFIHLHLFFKRCFRDDTTILFKPFWDIPIGP